MMTWFHRCGSNGMRRDPNVITAARSKDRSTPLRVSQSWYPREWRLINYALPQCRFPAPGQVEKVNLPAGAAQEGIHCNEALEGGTSSCLRGPAGHETHCRLWH